MEHDRTYEAYESWTQTMPTIFVPLLNDVTSLMPAGGAVIASQVPRPALTCSPVNLIGTPATTLRRSGIVALR
jgi:hypothetical protein